MPRASCFSSLEAASSFFEPGSLGYSVTRQPGRLDGIELRTEGWAVQPLEVDEVSSSYFSESDVLPRWQYRIRLCPGDAESRARVAQGRGFLCRRSR